MRYLPLNDIEVDIDVLANGHRGGEADHANRQRGSVRATGRANHVKRLAWRPVAAALLAAAATVACSTTTREPGPGDVRPGTRQAGGRPPATGVSADSARRYTEADVRFMQRMIAHHAQALAMTSLVPTRTSRDDIRLLAGRIEASQQHEIAMMRRWLESRGQEVPSLDAAHEHHGTDGHQALMPGMLTGEELAQLAKATGAEFDRLFLQLMTRHHEGALTMVAEFFATPGAGQEAEIFGLASDVDADQRAEIRRMRALQGTPPGAPPAEPRRR
jgi:uncharacterized protein (DUF305 family)